MEELTFDDGCYGYTMEPLFFIGLKKSSLSVRIALGGLIGGLLPLLAGFGALVNTDKGSGSCIGRYKLDGCSSVGDTSSDVIADDWCSWLTRFRS